MLDRVVSKEKEKVQFYLAPETIKAIFDRAASFSPRKTQSKYITDLVEADASQQTADEILRNLFGILTGDEARAAIVDLERTALELRQRIGEG